MVLASLVVCVSVVQADPNSDLVRAVRMKNIELVRVSLKNGADPNQRLKGNDSVIYPLLQEACFISVQDRKASYEIARLLIEAQADVNALSSDGNPTVFSACDNRDTLRLMIDKKADLSARNRNRDGIIMQAINIGNSSNVEREEIIKMLLDAKADVNAVNSNNETALIYECRFGRNVKVAGMLIDAGASKTINIRDRSGWTALMWVKRSMGNDALVEKMKKSGAVFTEEDQQKINQSMMGG